MKRTIEELLETPYWIIDILPEQVPKDSPGQYFAVEQYFLKEAQLDAVKQKHINVILKLNCYRSISLDEEERIDPPPDQIADGIRGRHLCILTGDSMIVSEPDETWMTLYDPDEHLLDLITSLSASEGLFVWRPQE